VNHIFHSYWSHVHPTLPSSLRTPPPPPHTPTPLRLVSQKLYNPERNSKYQRQNLKSKLLAKSQR
jgi:hypothetical protein